jgi:hypothetical protein
MANEPRYVFGDALTGKIIEEIPCTGTSLTMTLGDGGEFRGTFGLDLTGKNNEDLVNATIPGKSFVVVESGDGSVVHWGGLVWSRTYQSQAKSVQVYAKTLDQYPTKRIVFANREWENIDAREILIDLFEMMQADPNSIIVSLPTDSYSGLEIPYFEVMSDDVITYRSAMDSVTNTINGFEWTVDWVRNGNSYNRTLRLGAPLGQAPGLHDVVFEYPGPILNYWRNDTVGSAGTNIVGVGSGEGSSMGSVEVVHADLLGNGFPRLDTSIAFKDITDADLLAALTEKQAHIYKVPQPVYTVELKADREPIFGSYGIGDACRLIMNDPLHPGGQSYSTRIIGWEYYPQQSDRASEVRLIFEGDEEG